MNLTESDKPRPDNGSEQGPSLKWAEAGSYGTEFRRHLLEQYKLTVEMADNLSARRSETNQFYLAACAALLSVAAVVYGATPGIPIRSPPLTVALSVVGMLLSVVWGLTIFTYRSFNRVKFRLINEMETRLPVNPYQAEWDLLKVDRPKDLSQAMSSHKQLTSLEIFVPAVLFVSFLALSIASTLSII